MEEVNPINWLPQHKTVTSLFAIVGQIICKLRGTNSNTVSSLVNLNTLHTLKRSTTTAILADLNTFIESSMKEYYSSNEVYLNDQDDMNNCIIASSIYYLYSIGRNVGMNFIQNKEEFETAYPNIILSMEHPMSRAHILKKSFPTLVILNSALSNPRPTGYDDDRLNIYIPHNKDAMIRHMISFANAARFASCPSFNLNLEEIDLLSSAVANEEVFARGGKPTYDSLYRQLMCATESKKSSKSVQTILKKIEDKHNEKIASQDGKSKKRARLNQIPVKYYSPVRVVPSTFKGPSSEMVVPFGDCAMYAEYDISTVSDEDNVVSHGSHGSSPSFSAVSHCPPPSTGRRASTVSLDGDEEHSGLDQDTLSFSAKRFRSNSYSMKSVPMPLQVKMIEPMTEDLMSAASCLLGLANFTRIPNDSLTSTYNSYLS